MPWATRSGSEQGCRDPRAGLLRVKRFRWICCGSELDPQTGVLEGAAFGAGPVMGQSFALRGGLLKQRPSRGHGPLHPCVGFLRVGLGA